MRNPLKSAAPAPIMISVAMITYNHERFIAQALDSALAQEVDGPFEIVVADDCSTDRTPMIVAEYRRRHPDRIRVLERSTNRGMVKNFMETYRACRGRYIAFLEGDDYWTSPDKLRKQMDLLERDARLALCFHRVRMVGENPERSVLHPGDGATIARTVDDLLRGDCLVTCSTMVRKLFDELPAWCAEAPLPDWTTFTLHAIRGDIGYLDEAMAVYRLHAGSGWSSLPRVNKLPRKIETRRRAAEALGSPYDRILFSVIARLTAELDRLQAAEAVAS